MSYKPGIDHISSVAHILQGKRIGLLTNPSGVNAQMQATIDILAQHFELTRLFAPEHGIRGELQAGAFVSSYTDSRTGLEVVSLYGENRADALHGIDCMVYDIQDLGLRHFSYPYLMADMMKACAKCGIPFVVLDRYNPFGLEAVSGNLFDNQYSCSVGGYSLPTQYALTAGELAQYINVVFEVGCELYVAPCLGISREKTYRDYQPLWIQPSPNCPTFDTATCYIGTVLFEGTNVSEGRGTTRPFELIGAPWMKNNEVADKMNAMDLGGVVFRPAYFTPTFSKYQGELCRGLQIHVTDATRFEPYRCALWLLDTIKTMHDAFAFTKMNDRDYFIDSLAGTNALRSADFAPDQYITQQKPLLEEFKAKTEVFHLYH
ncbi:MAG: DUF1343 domain-containing protein [Clostridia bacterium]|nr:DUF1343 domain-containing protein [Clostridia bacterium]